MDSRLSSFAFHAAAPCGEWLNDPNGLACVDGRYLLFAQHSVEGPNEVDVGWGRFSSDDLLHWRWDGVAITPMEGKSAYSGSLFLGQQGLTAYFTRHAPAESIQTQHRTSGQPWSGQSVAFGPSGRNCRDPFVFWCAATADWRMLVADPCDWTNWSGNDSSSLSVWASPDALDWRPVGRIGPWHDPGVMWEVPVLIDFGAQQALVLSLIDRRGGGTRCQVRYWVGQFDGAQFHPALSTPVEGALLDHGPDFYAAIPNLQDGWPNEHRVIVAWAANWLDARSHRLAGGARGGPITMPRQIVLRDGRLRQTPLPAADRLASRRGVFIDRLELGSVTLEANRRQGSLHLKGLGKTQRSKIDWVQSSSDYRLFEDNGLNELFIGPEGVTVTWLDKRASK